MHDISVRPVELDADGIPISGWLATPKLTPPRGTIVAIHGGGIRSGYFRGGVRAEQSLLDVGAAFGWSVLALDRPGYGASAAVLPDGQTLVEQAATISSALSDFARRNPVGDGVFLLAHSYGGALALTLAADHLRDDLVAVDISGCGLDYAVDVADLPAAGSRGTWWLNWGLLRCYAPDTFRFASELTAPMPAREVAEARTWSARLPQLAREVRVPIRFTFAEHERWWRQDDEALAQLAALFERSAGVAVERQPYSGHNISLGFGARSYHLRAIAFFEDALLGLADRRGGADSRSRVSALQ